MELYEIIKKYSILKKEEIISFKKITPVHSIFIESILFMSKSQDYPSNQEYVQLHLLEISEKGHAISNFPLPEKITTPDNKRMQELYDSIKTSSDFYKLRDEEENLVKQK